jgi:hypothetical protein
MATTAVFLAKITADASQAVSEFRKVDGQVDKTTTSSVGKFTQFSTVAKGAVAGIGAVAVFELGKRAVGAASNLNESINAVNVTFGDAAEGVLALGEKSATAVGLSNTAFNSMAVSFSAFADRVAGEGGDVVGVIDELSVRAADFASVMNIDVSQAVDAFTSGLAGEAEPLKRFGINLLDSEVKAYALREGLIEVGETMDENTKVQARYGLLMESTNKVAGDFSNTSDGLANSSRVLSAELENLSADLGEELVPILEGMMPVLHAAIDGFGLLGDAFGAARSLGNGLGRILSPWNEDERRANYAIVDSFNEATDAAGEYYEQATTGATSIEQVRAKAEELGLAQHTTNLIVLDWVEAQKEATAAVEGHGDAMGDLDGATAAASVTLEAAAGFLEGVATMAGTAARNADALEAKWSGLTDSLSDRSAFLDIEDGWDSIESAAIDAYVAAVEGADNAEAAGRDHERSIIAQKERVIDYGREVLNLPPESLTNILAMIDDGKLAEAEWELAMLSRPRYAEVRLRVTGQQSVNGDIIGQRAFGSSIQVRHSGGVVDGPPGSEQLVLAMAGETVLPTHKPGYGSTSSPMSLPAMSGASNVTMTIAPGAVVINGNANGDQVVDALALHVRRNGPGGIRQLLQVA